MWQIAQAIKFRTAKLSALAELGHILTILKSRVNSKYMYKPVGVGLFPSGTIKFIAEMPSAAYNNFLRCPRGLRSNIALQVIYKHIIKIFSILHAINNF